MSETGAMANRILVVEDEAHIAAGLKLNLELEGYQADVAPTARDAGHLLLSQAGYDVIVLDVMLPDVDGFTFCRRLRDSGNYTPVLMLTARTHADDRVAGLEAGADDYLAKPFDLAELMARVRSLLRRRAWHEAETAPAAQVTTLSFGPVEVDFATHSVTVAGEPARLTTLELRLLRYFGDNAGRVVSRRELLERVWRLANHPNTRTVDNFIVRLRRHLEPDPAKPRYFVSVRGAGYIFRPDGAP